jgi:hypothetical protein
MKFRDIFGFSSTEKGVETLFLNLKHSSAAPSRGHSKNARVVTCVASWKKVSFHWKAS